ncbi:MAG: PadR family transcriptional regulator [Parvularcula sp.]|jgi:DNA-binding PadR family transcriptional regulator|nr:PadR family transcriptional regulator [Parvularcula sp.]
MDYKINNAECVLLLIIAEQPGVNGYRLRQTVTERGMDAWAGVGHSSIYVVLKKLKARGLVSSKADIDKRTKGAKGEVYSVLRDGKAILTKALLEALAQCREHDPRFNIALSGLEMLDRNEVSACLKKRHNFLGTELKRLVTAERSQGDLPISANLLFDHVKNGILGEIEWLERTLIKLETMEVSHADDT